MMRFHNLLERAGRRLWPIFSGVIVVEAQKRLYQGAAGGAARLAPRLRAGAVAAGRGYARLFPDRLCGEDKREKGSVSCLPTS